jgi:hypothetical protein
MPGFRPEEDSMSAPSTVPVTVTEQAAAHVAELGMQAELEQLIEQTRRLVPALKHIEVVLALPYDTGDEPGIVIEAWRGDTYRPGDPAEDQWDDWKIRTYSPDIWRHFTMMTHYLGDHAG